MSCAKVVELHDEGIIVLVDASSRRELCLEESPSIVSGKEEPTVQKNIKSGLREQETVVVDDFNWKKRGEP